MAMSIEEHWYNAHHQAEFVFCPVCGGEGKINSYKKCYFCLGDETVPKERAEEWWRNQYDKIYGHLQS